MAFAPVQAAPDDLLIAVEYSPDGTSWAKLRDHPVLAWMCDVGSPPAPVIIGPLPAVTAQGSGLKGAPYVVRHGQAYATPDGATRGTSLDMFTALSADGCQLYGAFVDNALGAEFRAWGAANPSLYLTEDPVVTAQKAAAAAHAAAQAAERAKAEAEAQAKEDAARAKLEAAHAAAHAQHNTKAQHRPSKEA